MNETRVIGKLSTGIGGYKIFSILADAKIAETTYTVFYDTWTKTWSKVEWIALFLKWMNVEIKEYGESIEVPPELVEEIKRKQKIYDDAHPKTEGS